MKPNYYILRVIISGLDDSDPFFHEPSFSSEQDIEQTYKMIEEFCTGCVIPVDELMKKHATYHSIGDINYHKFISEFEIIYYFEIPYNQGYIISHPIITSNTIKNESWTIVPSNDLPYAGIFYLSNTDGTDISDDLVVHLYQGS